MVIFHGYVNVYQRILRTALLFLLLLLFLVIAFSGYYDFHCPVLKVSQPFLPNPGLVATVWEFERKGAPPNFMVCHHVPYWNILSWLGYLPFFGDHNASFHRFPTHECCGAVAAQELYNLKQVPAMGGRISHWIGGRFRKIVTWNWCQVFPTLVN